MPWKTSDVDQHVKGLSDHQKTVWVAVANSALKRCLDGGGKDATCAPSAIKQASAMAQNAPKQPMKPKEAAALAERLTGVLALEEKGRVFSAKNEAELRSALATLQALLAQVGSDAPDAAASEAMAEAAAVALAEAELSFNDTTQALRNALSQASPNGKRYYWVRDCWDDAFVYEDDGPDGSGPSRLYKRSYVVGDDGTVTLGNAVEVVQRTVYDPVGTQASESADVEVGGDFVALVEKAVRRDSTVPLKVIAPGWGSSGYYGAEMLERDGPKVFTKGTKMFWDHPTAAEESERPERSLRDLAAEFVSDARWDAKGTAGPGLYADAKVFGGFKESIEELAPHIGVSIRALGKGRDGEAEGKKGKVIESLVAAKSVDFVTVPGAGGQVCQLFESARSRATTQHTPEEGSEVTEAEARALKESNDAKDARLAALEESNARLRERQLLSDARTVAQETLRTIQMPDATRARLIEGLSKNPPAKDGDLDREAFVTQVNEAAKAELAYIGQVAGAGAIRGMGSIGTEDVNADEAAAALESTFKRLGLSESGAKIAAGGRA